VGTTPGVSKDEIKKGLAAKKNKKKAQQRIPYFQQKRKSGVLKHGKQKKESDGEGGGEKRGEDRKAYEGNIPRNQLIELKKGRGKGTKNQLLPARNTP